MIVGGGVTGAALGYYLAQRGVPTTVFEPRPTLGAGLAYGTDDPTHRINVPATRMSMIVDDENHFARWLTDNKVTESDPDSLWPDDRVFARRSDFARYMDAVVSPWVTSGHITHRRERVISVARHDNGWRVMGDRGSDFLAEQVIIATTHPAPTPPAIFKNVQNHPRFVADPFIPNALKVIRSADRVLIVGAGLTMADVVASLDHAHHHGPIVAFSRRGQRSKGQAPAGVAPYGDFTSPPLRTARALVTAIRRAVDDAAEQGQPWQAVFDAVRRQGQTVWAALPLIERRRVVRHLRPFWDARRFRLAPMIQEIQERFIAEGRLTLPIAAATAVRQEGDEIIVTLTTRKRETLEGRFDAVVITTGPAHSSILQSQTFLADLTATGHLTLDSTGLGVATTENAEAIDREGQPVPGLYIAGPLSRGTFGELMGLAEVTAQAHFLAGLLASHR